MFNEYYTQKLHTKPDWQLRDIAHGLPEHFSGKKFHIIGICGTMMGTLAGMLIQLGYAVTGSDSAFYAPMGDEVKQLGIPLYTGYAAENIADDCDAIIIANTMACGPANPEVIRALDSGKPIISGAESVESLLIQNAQSFVVAGTHGKTTTTGMLATVMQQLRLNPSFLIGGVMQQQNHSFHSEHNPAYFVIEGDEYGTAFFDMRPKFLHYKPNIAVITSLEWDHVDFYPSFSGYRDAFHHLCQLTTDALIICNESSECAGLIEIAQNIYMKKVVSYGYSDTSDVWVETVSTDELGQHICINYEKTKSLLVTLQLYGRYNALNACAVFASLHTAGLLVPYTDAEIADAFAQYKGMKRRQEIVFETDNYIIIDDFAHHPTAVTETLRGVRTRFPDRRIVALFEPRSNTARRAVFQDLYPEALSVADCVYLKAPTVTIADVGADLMNPQMVIDKTAQLCQFAKLFQTTDEIVNDIVHTKRLGDVYVIMSNGVFDDVCSKLSNILEYE